MSAANMFSRCCFSLALPETVLWGWEQYARGFGAVGDSSNAAVGLLPWH